MPNHKKSKKSEIKQSNKKIHKNMTKIKINKLHQKKLNLLLAGFCMMLICCLKHKNPEPLGNKKRRYMMKNLN